MMQRSKRLIFLLVAAVCVIMPRAAFGIRCPGLPAVSIEELEIKGTLRVNGHWVALAYGPTPCALADGSVKARQTYLVQSGDQLWDGVVVEVTQDALIIQPVDRETGKPRGRRVEKRALPAPTPSTR